MIRWCWDLWVNNGRYQGQDGSGRHRSTVKRKDRAIVKAAVTVPDSSLSINHSVACICVSTFTFGTWLRKWISCSYWLLWLLLLTPVHRRVQLKWCHRRSNWNCTDCEHIQLSDEIQFQMGHDSNCRRFGTIIKIMKKSFKEFSLWNILVCNNMCWHKP